MSWPPSAQGRVRITGGSGSSAGSKSVLPQKSKLWPMLFAYLCRLFRYPSPKRYEMKLRIDSCA